MIGKSSTLNPQVSTVNLKAHLERCSTRHQELEQLLAAPDLYDDPKKAQELTREHSRLGQAVEDASRLLELDSQIEENKAILSANEDAELVELATEELPSLEEDREKVYNRILAAIVPPDPNENRNTIVEIRAGAGGDEAAIFAGDLFRMYSRYAERTGWKLETLDSNPSESGGYKEVSFTLLGTDVFKMMQFESGVHRVQRVPATESQGRIHTSTATVAVLPEAEEVDVEIKSDDIRVEVCRASGPGGQGVNTTDSAVQIMHIPTGIIVRCQDGRSQLKNKDKAMSILRARLFEQKKQEEEAKYAANRRSQVGTGERNEKIRTYNYPQSRITDHRIQFTSHNLTNFMDGDLHEMFDRLQSEDLAKRLESLDLN